MSDIPDTRAQLKLANALDAAGFAYPIVLTVRQSGDTLTPVIGPTATTEQRAQIAAIVAAFDPTPTADEKTDHLIFSTRVLAALLVEAAARIEGQPVPTWAINTIRQGAARVIEARR